ncbi:MAG: phospholipase D-like domain-containing protein [Candidatus Parvarchaeum sp.]
MFFDKKIDAQYYSGSNSYIYVEKLIKDSKELLIVSPYIDEHYAHFLISNSRGKKIKVISSSLDKKAERILTQGITVRYLIFGLIFFAIANMFEYLMFGINEVFIIGTSLFLIIFLVIFPKGSKVEFRKPKGFVHAKFYIGDNEVIQGSANLTYNGMHKNVENISIIHDEKDIEKLRKEFYKLW